MKLPKIKLRKPNFPILRLYIEIPLIRIQTSVMSHAFERDAFDYVVLNIKIFKWSFEFNLYKPNRRRY